MWGSMLVGEGYQFEVNLQVIRLSSSSSSVGPMANATDVLQPSRFIALTLFPPPVWTFPRSPPGTPTSTTTREIPVAKGGTMWARIWPVILPEIATSTSIQGSFTCRKSATRERRLYFPSEGRRAEHFFALKNPDGFGQV
jgi:hypothetical protein